MAVIVDSSTVVDFLHGRSSPALERAITDATLVLSPLVIAEILSGDATPAQRELVADLLQESPVHATPLEHWMNVGALRRILRTKGLNVTLPDAHVAQCALDLDATLLTRDEIFAGIAKHTALRVLR
ncbi:MAG TPA: PIN domain-containing protein [Thermoanaerobaculia bacterium]|nr:PIN domain-containing protein [Thermoanaerobaculia bacterium]